MKQQKHEFTYEGKNRTIFKRGDKWSIRLYTAYGDRWISLKTGILGSAIEAAKAIIKANQTMKAEDFREALGQKSRPAQVPTLGSIIDAFSTCPLNIGGDSRYGYIWAMRTIIEWTLGKETDWKERPVSILDGDLVFNYRTEVTRRAIKDRATAADLERTQRSANSCLRQARALFSDHMLEYYRIKAGLLLPDLAGFRSAPGFRGTVKTDYQPPSDELIRTTLEELEVTRDLHPERYLACWLAIGFGLRKSEVSALKGNCFLEINGRHHVEIRAVSCRDGESDLTKNGTRAPRIPVANGAWPHLQTLIEPVPPGAYLIGGTATYRTETLFREVNAWLREVGFKTQKGFHELRAYAGCQVALRDGLLAASKWLRHESITTTQQFYGRYLKIQVSDNALALAPAAQITSFNGQQETGPESISLPTIGFTGAAASLGRGGLLKGSEHPNHTMQANFENMGEQLKIKTATGHYGAHQLKTVADRSLALRFSEVCTTGINLQLTA